MSIGKKMIPKKQKFLNRNMKDKINEKLGRYSYRAFMKAKKGALAQGKAITVKIKDGIYMVYPNGEKELIKKVKPNIKIKKRTFNIAIK